MLGIWVQGRGTISELPEDPFSSSVCAGLGSEDHPAPRGGSAPGPRQHTPWWQSCSSNSSSEWLCSRPAIRDPRVTPRKVRWAEGLKGSRHMVLVSQIRAGGVRSPAVVAAFAAPRAPSKQPRACEQGNGKSCSPLHLAGGLRRRHR